MQTLLKQIAKHIGIVSLTLIGVYILSYIAGLDMVSAQQTTATAISEALNSKIYVYNSILNALYLLIRPALALAGFALDNSMVYGSFLGLDAPLFLIWNIIKNIANFILGFMVLFEILKNFFTTGEQWKKAFDVIKKSLIAWVLIQSSWFLMGAVIDVSTIATYAIGGMPLTILGGDNQCSDLWNIKTLPVWANLNFGNSNQQNTIDDSFSFYYFVKTGDDQKVYFSPCKVYNGRWVVWQQYWSGAWGIPYQEDYCIVGDNTFAFFGAGQIATTHTLLQGVSSSLGWDGGSNYVDYRNNLNQLEERTGGLSDPVARSGWLDASLIFDAWAPSITGNDSAIAGIHILNKTDGYFLDQFGTAPAIKDLVSEAQWYVWVLITLYKSILNFVSFQTGSSSTETFVMFLEVLMKVAFGIALLVPLILFAVALIIRVGYIWMFIALSPIIALKIAFTDDSSIKSLWASIPILKDDIGSIVRMIFAPVLVTFAVSFALVFMTGLITSINNNADNPNACMGTQTEFYESMNINIIDDENTKTYQIGGIAEVNQSVFGIDVTGPQRDIFGWILINLFGVAIVWILLLTAIEAIFKWTPVGDRKLSKIATQTLASVPIIPIPDGAGWFTGVWVGTASKVLEAKADQISNRPRIEAEELLNRGKKEDASWSWSSSTTTTNTTASAINFSDDATERSTQMKTLTAGTFGQWDNAAIEKIGTGLDSKAIAKNILTNPTTSKEYVAAIPTKEKNDKLKGVSERFAKEENLSSFSTEELQNLWKRDDDLARYLLPSANNQIIKIADDYQEVVFNEKDGSYDISFNPTGATQSSYDANKKAELPDYLIAPITTP